MSLRCGHASGTAGWGRLVIDNAVAHSTVGADLDHRGDDGDAVFPRQIRSLPDVDYVVRAAGSGERGLRLSARSAQRVAEQDGDSLIGIVQRRVGSQVDEFEAVDATTAYPAQTGLDAIKLAPGAEAARCGEEGQSGNQSAESQAHGWPAHGIRGRGGGKDDEAEAVGASRRPGILDRPLPYPRLDQLEVGNASQAESPARH